MNAEFNTPELGGHPAAADPQRSRDRRRRLAAPRVLRPHRPPVRLPQPAAAVDRPERQHRGRHRRRHAPRRTPCGHRHVHARERRHRGARRAAGWRHDHAATRRTTKARAAARCTPARSSRGTDHDETGLGALAKVAGRTDYLMSIMDPFDTDSGGIGTFPIDGAARTDAIELYDSTGGSARASATGSARARAWPTSRCSPSSRPSRSATGCGATTTATASRTRASRRSRTSPCSSSSAPPPTRRPPTRTASTSSRRSRAPAPPPPRCWPARSTASTAADDAATIRIQNATGASQQAALAGLAPTESNDATANAANVGGNNANDSDGVLGGTTAQVTFTLGSLAGTNDNNAAAGDSVDREGYNRHIYDFGFVPAVSLGNRVWFDTDNDSTLDGTEVSAPGVAVATVLRRERERHDRRRRADPGRIRHHRRERPLLLRPVHRRIRRAARRAAPAVARQLRRRCRAQQLRRRRAAGGLPLVGGVDQRRRGAHRDRRARPRQQRQHRRQRHPADQRFLRGRRALVTRHHHARQRAGCRGSRRLRQQRRGCSRRELEPHGRLRLLHRLGRQHGLARRRSRWRQRRRRHPERHRDRRCQRARSPRSRRTAPPRSPSVPTASSERPTTPLGGVLSDATGNYVFAGLPEGTYITRITAPVGFRSSTDPANGATPLATDLDDNGTGTGIGHHLVVTVPDRRRHRRQRQRHHQRLGSYRQPARRLRSRPVVRPHHREGGHVHGPVRRRRPRHVHAHRVEPRPGHRARRPHGHRPPACRAHPRHPHRRQRQPMDVCGPDRPRGHLHLDRRHGRPRQRLPRGKARPRRSSPSTRWWSRRRRRRW